MHLKCAETKLTTVVSAPSSSGLFFGARQLAIAYVARIPVSPCPAEKKAEKSWKKLEKAGRRSPSTAVIACTTSVGLRQSVYVNLISLGRCCIVGTTVREYWSVFFYLITAHLQLVSTPLSMHRQSLFPIDILLWLYLLFRLYLKYQLTVDRATIGAIGPSINRLLIDYELCSLTLMYSFQFYHSKNMNKKLKFEHNMRNLKTHLMMLKSSL